MKPSSWRKGGAKELKGEPEHLGVRHARRAGKLSMMGKSVRKALGGLVTSQKFALFKKELTTQHCSGHRKLSMMCMSEEISWRFGDFTKICVI